MSDEFDATARAFSRKAAVYDAFGDDHVNLTRMRAKVYAHLAALVPPESRLLELNAGTGLDAVNLVRRGYRVHATDIADGMVAAIERKVADYDLSARLTVERRSFTELDAITAGPFDAIFSNSGGLNCVADLTRVTRALPRLLRPGGSVTWVIMPRICPWELALSLKDWGVGTRRLRPGGVVANVEGLPVRTWYFSATAVQRAFGSRFTSLKREGLSVVTPPADNKTFASNHPHLYRLLVRADDLLCTTWPFNGWGDFFILSMRYDG